MGWAQVENKTESTREGEKAKRTCPMSKSSEVPQDQGNLLRGIVNWSDVARPFHSDLDCRTRSVQKRFQN